MAEAARQFLSPENAAQRLAIALWKDNLLNGYFAIIGVAFIAREIRNLLERRARRLIAVSYPGRTVRVPRGWTVLEASRGFHLPHASMCGGRARCSTCRVRVTAGEANCPPAAADEQATLGRIGAPADVRLACQLRPAGDVSVIPLVRTAQPVYRQTVPQRGGEREIVVLTCDFRNRAELAADHLPQDMLYVLTLCAEGIGNAVRAHGGVLSSIAPDSICALFGVDHIERAAQRALQAAGAIEGVIADLNNRLGRQREARLQISLTVHAGHAAVGEIGSAEASQILAIGDAIDAAAVLRKAASKRGKVFAISRQVYDQAGLSPPAHEAVALKHPGADGLELFAYLSDDAPIPSPSWTLHGQLGRRAVLKRLWTG